MNIQSILNNNFFSPVKTDNTVTTPKYGLKLTAPLNKDTVSFQGSAFLKNRNNCIPQNLAKNIEKEARQVQTKINKFFIYHFKSMFVTDNKSLNIVQNFLGRSKKANSIIEKAASRGEFPWETKAEILKKMTDLNGVKFILRDGTQKTTEKFLKKFEKLMLEGKIKIVEIENKRPISAKKLNGITTEQYDYVSSKYLKHFKHIAEKTSKKLNFIEADYTKSNYSALHMLAEIPGITTRPLEIQIMGHDVSIYKNLDDVLYKILDNKNVDKKYHKIEEIIRPLTKEGNEKLLEKFNKYRREAFLFQREKEPIKYIKNKKEYFLPLKYNLPQEMDLNNLYNIFLKSSKN